MTKLRDFLLNLGIVLFILGLVILIVDSSFGVIILIIGLITNTIGILIEAIRGIYTGDIKLIFNMVFFKRNIYGDAARIIGFVYILYVVFIITMLLLLLI